MGVIRKDEYSGHAPIFRRRRGRRLLLLAVTGCVSYVEKALHHVELAFAAILDAEAVVQLFVQRVKI